MGIRPEKIRDLGIEEKLGKSDFRKMKNVYAQIVANLRFFVSMIDVNLPFF